MKFWLIFLSTCLFTLTSFASSDFSNSESHHVTGLVEIQKGRKIYVDWLKAEGSQPTVILLNGLTYNTTDWDKFVRELKPSGLGILRYDPKGMGKTLENDGPVTGIIRIEDQARDLDLLTKKLGLKSRLNLVALSYGGGLALAFAEKYAHRINKVILISPYTGPLEQQDLYIKSQIAWARLMFPLSTASDEELYGYFLKQIVYFVNPYAEPSMLRNKLSPEAVFQMTQGIRTYNVTGAAKNLPKRSVHLVIAGADQYIPRQSLLTFWDGLAAEVRASKIVVNYSEHKIPEAFPRFNALWVKMIMDETFGLDQGSSFVGDPFSDAIVQE